MLFTDPRDVDAAIPALLLVTDETENVVGELSFPGTTQNAREIFKAALSAAQEVAKYKIKDNPLSVRDLSRRGSSRSQPGDAVDVVAFSDGSRVYMTLIGRRNKQKKIALRFAGDDNLDGPCVRWTSFVNLSIDQDFALRRIALRQSACLTHTHAIEDLRFDRELWKPYTSEIKRHDEARRQVLGIANTVDPDQHLTKHMQSDWTLKVAKEGRKYWLPPPHLHQRLAIVSIASAPEFERNCVHEDGTLFLVPSNNVTMQSAVDHYFTGFKPQCTHVQRNMMPLSQPFVALFKSGIVTLNGDTRTVGEDHAAYFFNKSSREGIVSCDTIFDVALLPTEGEIHHFETYEACSKRAQELQQICTDIILAQTCNNEYRARYPIPACTESEIKAKRQKLDNLRKSNEQWRQFESRATKQLKQVSQPSKDDAGSGQADLVGDFAAELESQL